LILVAVLLWIGWDLAVPSRHDLRDFDPAKVARLETAMWRSYYTRRPAALFMQLSEALRGQYGMPFWRSGLAALYAARAAVTFQKGHNRSEYARALPDLERYYGLIRRGSKSPFDVAGAAGQELEWWIVHRERAGRPAGDLERALAELQAGVYGRPAGDFSEHARARAEAMSIRDSTAAGGGTGEKDWMRIRALLESSWGSLHAAVRRPMETANR
jgi:hypothetical protein